MSRFSLLASSIATVIVTLSPFSFSAAVVHTGELVSADAGAAARVILKRDLERLHPATRRDIAAAPLSLATRPAGGHLTLTGIVVVTTNGILSPDILADSSEPEVKVGKVTASKLGEAPAPAAAAPENIGAASNFGVVPEPSSMALLAMGAMAFLRRRRG